MLLGRSHTHVWGCISGYDKNTVSHAIRRMQAAGYLSYRKGPGRHFTYTVLELSPEVMRDYCSFVESRI